MEFGLESGNQTLDLTSIDGNYYNSTDIINIYKTFSEMEGETTIEARALKKDISQTQTSSKNFGHKSLYFSRYFR